VAGRDLSISGDDARDRRPGKRCGDEADKVSESDVSETCSESFHVRDDILLEFVTTTFRTVRVVESN